MSKKLELSKKTSQKSELLENATNKETVNALQDIVSVIKEEYNDYQLTKEMRLQIQKELNVSEETVNSWQTIVDVLDHIDITELARKHPEEIGKTAKTITSIIGCVFAPVGIVGNMIPEDSAAKIIEYSGMLLPSHIVNTIAKKQLEKKPSSEPTKTPKPITSILSKMKKPSKPTGQDNIEKLKQLAELKDAGIITADDYEAKKAELLSKI